MTSTKMTELYTLIAHSAGDLFCIIQPDTRAMEWSSDPAVALLGYPSSRSSATQADFLNLVHEEDRAALASKLETLMQGTRVELDMRLIKSDGQAHWVHWTGVPLVAQPDAPAQPAGVLRDIQHFRDRQASAYEARRMETVGTMASGIAHEFNNRLTPIQGYLELAIDHLGPDHPMAEGLQTAMQQVEHCTDLVSQIQCYGRKSMLMPDFLDLPRHLPPIVRLALSAAGPNIDQIELVEVLPERLAPLWVDQSRLQQAVGHLIRNAVQAMPDGGILTVSVEEVPITEHEKDGDGDRAIRIRIRDTGVGIPPEYRTRIFEPFFTTRGRAMARGMGLPMVQGMIAQHNGWMEIQTEIGQGTEVSLYLPIKRKMGVPHEVVADSDGTVPITPIAEPGRLLIADDEPFIRRLIRKVFQAEDWIVDEAEDYHAVLDKVVHQGLPYDLIILDLTMPGPTVEKTVQQIAVTRPDTPILFVSGYSRDDRIDRLMKMVPSDFMSKPFSPNALLSRVDGLIPDSALSDGRK